MKKPSAAFSVIIISIAILFRISSSPVSAQEQQDSLSTLIREGSALIDKGDIEGATTILVRAYMRAEKEGRKPEMALCQSELGRAFYLRKELTEAGIHYHKALQIYQALNDRSGIINTLIGLANNSLKAGDYTQARAFCLRVPPLCKGTDSEMQLAHAYDVLGQICFYTRDHQKACYYYEESLKIMESQGSETNQAIMLERIGYSYSAEGKSDKARQYFEKALAIHRKLNDKAAIARVLQNIGIAFFLNSDYDKARSYLEQSLSLHRESGDKDSLAYALSQMGAIHAIQSDFNSALHCYEEALEIYEERHNRTAAAEMLEKIGGLYTYQGNTDKESVYVEKALAIYRETGNKVASASLQRRLGEILAAKNDLASASQLIENAAALYKETGQHDKEALTLASLIDILIRKKELDKAQMYCSQLQQMLDSLKDRKTIASVYGQLAFIYEKESVFLKDPKMLESALICFKKALEITEETDISASVALYSFFTGDLLTRMNKIDEAEGYLRKSETISRKSLQRELLWMSIYKLGVCREMQGDLKGAAERYKESIAVIEEMSRLRIGNEEEKAEVQAKKTQVYEALIRVMLKLQQKGEKPGDDESFVTEGGSRKHIGSTYAAQAFYFSEKNRARVLTEMLMERQAELTHRVDPVLLEKQKQAITKLISLQRERESPNAGKSREALLLSVAREEDKLQSIRETIKADRPSYAALVYPDTAGVEDAGKAISEDTALLEYSITEEIICCFVITKTHFASVILPITRNKAEALVTSLLTSVKEQNVTTSESSIAQQLYDALISPVESQIGPCHHLLIIRDGALNYLPFEMLMNNHRFLIENYSISYAPSVSFLRLSGKKPGGRRDYLGVGNPAFDEAPDSSKDRVDQNFMRDLCSEKGMTWIPLPATKTEIENTALLFDGKKLVLLGKDATKERVKKEIGKYSIIHFATHGLFDDGEPILYSSIILSGANSRAVNDDNDGYLRAVELLSLNLDADLVVLSACKTGLGRSFNGEGLLGLSTAFFYAGARSLIASLWSVDDKSTAELFISFYRNLKSMTCCEALRAAKLSMIKKKYSPFYWAPFIYIGS